MTCDELTINDTLIRTYNNIIAAPKERRRKISDIN